MVDDQVEIESWLKDCIRESEDREQLEKWIESNDEIVFVYHPKEPRIEAFPSTWTLVNNVLMDHHLTTVCAPLVCAPLWNVTLERMDGLKRAACGERSEGRPLSFERDIARRLVSRGCSYEFTLWMIKQLVGNKATYEPSLDYTFGSKKTSTLEGKQSTRIRNAVDREWKQQHGEIPPTPQRLWWKDDNWCPEAPEPLSR